MHKGAPEEAGPLDLRILLILPALYRRWASTKLRTVAPWVGAWQCHDMYVGPPGSGAQDAWYSTSIIREYRHVYGIAYQGGTTDLWKLFAALCFYETDFSTFYGKKVD